MSPTPSDPPSGPPATLPTTFVQTLDDEAATHALGAALARGVRWLVHQDGHGLTVHFSGDLGAGKTTLIRALLRALGVTGRIKSPTYALMEPYQLWFSGTLANDPPGSGLEFTENLSLYCYHFDFYRFAEPQEFIDAGFRELFAEGALCLVEWPERANPDTGEANTRAIQPDLHIFLEPAHDPSSAGTASPPPDTDPVPGRLVRLVAHTPRGRQCLTAAGF